MKPTSTISLSKSGSLGPVALRSLPRIVKKPIYFLKTAIYFLILSKNYEIEGTSDRERLEGGHATPQQVES